MRAWPWEVDDDGHRRFAVDSEWTGAEGRGSPLGKLAGTGIQKGTELCGFSGRAAGLRSRCPTQPVSARQAPAGTPAVCEDLRSVRLQLSAVDRRAADPRATHVAVHP